MFDNKLCFVFDSREAQENWKWSGYINSSNLGDHVISLCRLVTASATSASSYNRWYASLMIRQENGVVFVRICQLFPDSKSCTNPTLLECDHYLYISF